MMRPARRSRPSASAPWRASAALAASSSRGSPRPPRARPSASRAGRGERRGRDPLDGPGEVDARSAARRPCSAAARSSASCGSSRELHREPVGGGDADQRRAADREPLDRVDRVGRAVQLEHDLLGRQPRLVEDLAGVVPSSAGARPESRCGDSAIARDASATGMAARSSPSPTCARRYGRTEALRGVGLESARASCSACSAPTAPASRRWSRSPAGSCGRPPAAPRSRARRPARSRRSARSATWPSCSASRTG